MSDCKCKHPCNPCNDNCPDDEEITEVELLDADECSGPCGGCCSNKCKDNCWINIQSTNECLTVDTSECGVVKITSHCPPIVTAWDNIRVDVEECQQDNCSLNYIVSADCKDEKVKACSGDSTPGYLNQKLSAWNGIVIDEINCWWWDAYLKIGIRDWVIPECPEPPDLQVNYDWSLLRISQRWDHNHIVDIEDATTGNFYDNVVMLGFLNNKDYDYQHIDDDANWPARFIETSEIQWGRDMYTGNSALATTNWIRIKQAWHYFVYWQVTVVLNRWDANRYFNLWRALMKLTREWNEYLIQTAKHWAYWTFVAAKWWNWIDVAQDWTISINRWTVNIWSEWWTYEVSFQQWSWMQPTSWFDWPWATLNVWVYLDLKVWDVLTLWYRPQSDVPSAKNKTGNFRITWRNDLTWNDNNRIIFGWTVIWLHPITPTIFQKWSLFSFIQ